jgi:hypothetical protein
MRAARLRHDRFLAVPYRRASVMPSTSSTSSTSSTAVIVVLALLVILYGVVQYASFRSKYDSVFSWYANVTAKNKNIVPNIGPLRVALGYERPWLAQYLTRPIPQTAAEFMLRLVAQERINPTYLLVGPGTIGAGGGMAALAGFCASSTAWADPANVLGSGVGTGGGAIPFDSALVRGYRCQLSAAACSGNIVSGDLSLATLWMHGYEEYVRQRFTSAATSVLQEWNYMFATDVPAPIAAENACGASSIVSDVFSAGVGAAGVGAMIGAPEGGIGALPGAIIGFILGAGGSLFGKSACF